MTRISSLLVASTLAILPISAFAQQAAAPAKTAEPTAVTTTAPTSAKTPAPVAKTETHGMSATKMHHAKTGVPAKTAEPAKS